MKIAIIGAGAMGRLWAWFLKKAGHEPVLVCRRREQAEAFWQEGLTVVEVDGQEEHVDVQACVGTEELADAGIAGAIVTVKSYVTARAGELLQALPGIPVLSLQNGLGNGETLEKYVWPERLAVGSTTHGAMAEGETKVLFKGQGATVIGDWSNSTTRKGQVMDEAGDEVGDGATRDPNEQSIFEFAGQPDASTKSVSLFWRLLLSPSGSPISLSENIRLDIWRKAMVNIGINPFTALLGLRNGELLEAEALHPYIKATVAEAEQVAAAEGLVLTDSFQRVLDVCRGTYANSSSMMQDRQHGRQTEIDALCGVIVELGKKHGIATPYNSQLVELIQSPSQTTLDIESLIRHFER